MTETHPERLSTAEAGDTTGSLVDDAISAVATSRRARFAARVIRERAQALRVQARMSRARARQPAPASSPADPTAVLELISRQVHGAPERGW